MATLNNSEKAVMINDEINAICLTKVDQEAKDDFSAFMKRAKNPISSLKHTYKMACNSYSVEPKQHLLDL